MSQSYNKKGYDMTTIKRAINTICQKVANCSTEDEAKEIDKLINQLRDFSIAKVHHFVQLRQNDEAEKRAKQKLDEANDPLLKFVNSKD